MLGRVFCWVQMPSTPIVVIHPPNALLIANECKRDGAGCLVEIHAQKLLYRPLYMCTTASDRAFGL